MLADLFTLKRCHVCLKAFQTQEARDAHESTQHHLPSRRAKA